MSSQQGRPTTMGEAITKDQVPMHLKELLEN